MGLHFPARLDPGVLKKREASPRGGARRRAAVARARRSTANTENRNGMRGGGCIGRRTLINRSSSAASQTAADPGGWPAMSKRAKTTGPESQTTVVGSAAVQFRVDYEQTKQLPSGKAIHSDVVSAGGHLWRICYYPVGDGNAEADKVEYSSIYLEHRSTTNSVKAIFEVFLMGRDGQPSTTATKRAFNEFHTKTSEQNSWGWRQFAKGTVVENDYVTDGHITLLCVIMVVHYSPIPVPPSDIGIHLGRLLDHKDGTDVSFIVNGETFCAHRAVLAARSPVFRVELFGSMAEATMSSITLQDITPPTFKAMLQFMYTDALPGEDRLEDDSAVQMFQDLLAAADRYALDRLKVICSQRLCDNVSVDTVAATLACAETYNCPELKNKCFDFFAVGENFKEAVFTEGFVLLVQKFPCIAAELKKKVRK